MSVHKTTHGYVVRWRDGEHNRQRTFDRHADAVRWDDETRRRRQLGTLSTLAPTITLNSYVSGTWAPVYGVLLAPRTREVYAQSYDRHVAPTLGAMPLHAIKPAVVARWQAATHAHGHEALRKARTVLSAVLQTAVEGELMATNPVRLVRAPKQPLKPEVRRSRPPASRRSAPSLTIATASSSPCSRMPACDPARRARR